MTRATFVRLLLVALALRVVAVFFSRGYEFVDQQFQYVDPAWHLATGNAWWRTWEWEAGIRSWAYPGLLAGLLRVVAALGCSDPETTMILVRAAHALVSLLPVAALALVLGRWRGDPHASRSVALVAASFVLVYAGVQPSGPTFAVGLSVSAVLLFEGRGLWPLAAGALLGVAFACRFQDALLGPVLFVAGLVQRRWRACLWLTLGAAVPVVAQGMLDVATWGSFLHSAFANVRSNVLEGKSASFGTDTVFVYVGALAAIVVPVVPEAFRILRAGVRTLPVAAAAALVYVIVHAFLERRQVRFVLPALALVQIVWIVGALRTTPPDRLSRVYRRVVHGLHALAFVFVSVAYFHRGAIDAALLLRADPSYEGRLLALGTSGEGIGGAYWLGRPRLDLEVVQERSALAAHLAARGGPWPLHVIHRDREGKGPLRADELGAGFTLREVGRTAAWPDWFRGSRRHVYVVDR